MAELKESRQVYYIPDNFIEEGRIFQGKIKIKNLIQAGILALIAAIPPFIIFKASPGMEIQFVISMFVMFCAPPALLGIVGFNGDSLFSAIKSAKKWRKNSTTMLYNPNPKLLKRDPLLTVVNQSRRFDEFIEMYENKKNENIRKKANLDIVEGKDYVFEEDEYVDNYTKRLKKKDRDMGKEFLISPEIAQEKAVIEIASEEEKIINLDDDISHKGSGFFDDDNHANTYGSTVDIDIDLDSDGGDWF